jgi:hypothetical protein
VAVKSTDVLNATAVAMLSVLAALAMITSRSVLSAMATRRLGAISVLRGWLAVLSVVALANAGKLQIIKSPKLLPVSGFLINDYQFRASGR